MYTYPCKNTYRRQTGRGLTGFIFCFALLGFTALIGLRLIPVYVDYFQIKASLHELSRDGDLINRSTEEILDFLQKNWQRNRVAALAPEQIHIDKQPHHVQVRIQYDVTKTILGNVDAVMHFNDSIDIGEID